MPTRVLLEGPEIEPLLAQAREEYGAEVRIVSADKIRTGGLGGFFAKQRYELSVEVPDEGSAEAVDPLLALVEATEPVRPRTVTPTPRANLVSTAGTTFAEVMQSVGGKLVGSTPAESSAAQSTEDIPAPVTPVRAATRSQAYTPPPIAPQRPAVEPQRPGAGPVRLAKQLTALGMPAVLAERATGSDPYQAIVKALAAAPRPAAAPGAPGDVLVIAGERSAALELARYAASVLRLDPTKILFAGQSTAGTGIHPSRRITGPDDARRRARRMQVSDGPHIVVLDAPVHGSDTAWTRAVRTALAPTAVWVAVDATRKTAETRRHLRALGSVDAIGVHGAAECADPASVLDLDLPIAVLDGRPADAHAWAALLSERLYQQRAEAVPCS